MLKINDIPNWVLELNIEELEFIKKINFDKIEFHI